MRRLPRIFLLLLAAPLLAQSPTPTAIVPGQERLAGSAEPQPWREDVAAHVLATDGVDVLLVWSGRHGVFATRLDREGRVLTPVRRIHEGVSPPVRLFATSIDGTWIVFVKPWFKGIDALRLTRDLELIERRALVPDVYTVRVYRAGDELVVHEYDTSRVHRLRSDLTPIAPPVTLPELGEIAPAPGGRFAVLIARAAGSALRLYDGKRFGDPVRIADGFSQLLWTGSELALIGGATLQRYDGDLRPIGGPVALDLEAETVTLLGDDTLWIGGRRTTNLAYRGWQRIRRGVPLDSLPMREGAPVAVQTSDGWLLLASSLVSVAFLPPPGGNIPSPLVWTPVAFVVPSETLLSVAMSPSEVAVARTGAVAFLDHDAARLRELPLNEAKVAIATDGQSFYAFNGSAFWKLAPEAPRVAVDSRGDAAVALGWTGTEFVTVWNNWIRLERLSAGGEIALACGRKVAGRYDNASDFPAMTVASDGTVLLTWPGWMALFRDGCPIASAVADPLTRFPHRTAWRNGEWAMAFVDEDEIVRFAFTRAGPFVERAGEISREATLLSLTGTKDGWALLYRIRDTLVAALLGADGDPTAFGLVANDSEGKAELVALPNGRLLAVYSRRVDEAPFLGATRVFTRFLELEQGQVRRRGVRH